jgi:hypothetical protein
LIKGGLVMKLITFNGAHLVKRFGYSIKMLCYDPSLKNPIKWEYFEIDGRSSNEAEFVTYEDLPGEDQLLVKKEMALPI